MTCVNMNKDLLKSELTEDEGLRSYPYKDTEGIWTGGIGHNLEAHRASWQDIASWLKVGIPEIVINQWFDQDIGAAIEVTQAIFGDIDALPDPVARTLVNMAFDLMWELRDWHHLIAAVKAQDWQAAAASIMSSKFAAQGPNRCKRLAARIQS